MANAAAIPPAQIAPADAAAINQLYLSLLARPADPGGLASFSALLQSGTSLQTIAGLIAQSPEASDLSGLYLSELGRAIDPAGQLAFSAVLAAGGTLAAIRTAIATSTEAQADVAGLYQSELGRGPEAGGAAYWSGRLAGGASIAEVRAGIALSDESTADLAALYQTELGRTGDADGIAFYQGQEATGGSLAAIRATIAASVESQANLSALIAAGAAATLPQLTQLLAGGATLAALRTTYGTPAPTLTAALAHDTGTSASDGITQDATITGRTTGATTLQGSIDGSVGVSLAASLQPDGSFTLTPAQLATVDGGTLPPGAHVLHLVAGTATTATAITDIAFTLATPAPMSFDLYAADQTSAHHTMSAAATLVGTTTPGATVTLAPANGHPAVTVTADGTGAFRFAGVALAVGANPITLQAADVSGPGIATTVTLIRDGAPISGDVVVQFDSAARAAIAHDASAAPVGARALAIESLAVFDTMSGIAGQSGYAVTLAAPTGADTKAAVAEAADIVLDTLYPAQSATFDALLATTLATIPDSQSKTDGIAFGRTVALRELALRATDGSAAVTVFTGGTAPGQWRPTGPSFTPGLDPQYASVTPFALTSPGQFLPGAPPALTSAAYATSVNLTQSLGNRTSTTRTADQTQIALFWNDQTGTDSPPGQWNQIAATVAQSAGYSLAQDARLFAALNVAEADAGIAAWNSKYSYDAWRAVTAIQLGGTGNPALTADPTWQPLLTTPAFPEYAAGHGSFSGAAATVLASFFGDNTSFSATSESLTGVTRSYTSFSQAASEATESRIYGGIHFQFSADAALTLGHQVGAWTLQQFGTATTTAAPHVALDSAGGPGRAVPTITGQVTGAAGTVLLATFDNGQTFASVALDTAGRFSVTPAFATDGSQDGVHVVAFKAVDPASRVASAGYTFDLATRAPTIALAAGSLADGGTLTANSVLTGTVTPARGATLSALTYTLDSGTTRPIAFDPTADTFATTIDLFSTGAGPHTVVLTATDATGNATSNTLHVTAATPDFVVTSLTPAPGQASVGITFRPMVMFSRAVDPATLTGRSFYITDPSGAVVPTTIVPLVGGTGAWLLPQGAMPGSSTLTIHLDGALIKAADGTPLTVAGYGPTSTQLLQAFTTVSTTIVPGTSITGIIVDPGPDNTPLTPDDVSSTTGSSSDFAHDTWKLPLAGVKVFVLGHEDQAVFTDATGHFTLTNVPAGDVKLAVDGRTATNPPSGFFFPEMVMDLTVRPGVVNTVASDLGAQDVRVAEQANPSVYLPRIGTDVFTPLSTTAPTVVKAPSDSAGASGLNLTAQQIATLSLTVQPNTLLDASGVPVANATIGISPVPTSLVKDMLPPGLEQHTFDITIQAPGSVVLTQPAILTMPNVFGLTPGAKTYMLSFNHTTGLLEVDGTGTVSADGATVTSDPGSGVIQPGWHGYTDPKSRTKVKTVVKPPGGVSKELVQDYLGASDNYGSVGLASTFYSGVTNAESLLRYGIRNGSALVGNASAAVALSPAGKSFFTGVGKYAPIGLVADVAGTVSDTHTLADQSSELTTAPVMGVADLLVNTTKVNLDIAITGLDGASLVSGPAAVPEQIVKDTLNTVSLGISVLQIVGTFTGQLASDFDNAGNTDIFGPRFDPALTLHVSEDAWHGNAQITVNIDGVQVLGPTTITALHGSGQSQDIVVNGIVGAANHKVTVNFVNPGFGGTVDSQRNVYISGAAFNGQRFAFANTLYGANSAPTTSFLVGSRVTAAITAADQAEQQAISGLAFELPLLQGIVTDLQTLIRFKETYDPTKPLGGFSQSDLTNVYQPAAATLYNDNLLLGGHDRPGQLLANVNAAAPAGLAALIAGSFVSYNPPPQNLPPLTPAEIIARDAAFAAGLPYTRHFLSLGQFRGVASGTTRDSVSVAAAAVTAAVAVASDPASGTYTYYPPGQAQPLLGRLFAALTDQHGAVQRFSYDPALGLDRLLAPLTTYILDAFDPTSGETGQVSFRTNASGTDTDPQALPLTLTNATTGAGGLTVRQAYIIGVDPAIASNLVPGLTDLAALQQGLFDTKSLPTASGIQASVALKGEATGIALAGTASGNGMAGQSLALVATGSYGLAVVDVSTPTTPVILSQLRLPGLATGVAVDSQHHIAAVADGAGGLVLVSFADPTLPTILATVPGAFTHVVLFGSVAYASSGASVFALDGQTGDQLGQIDGASGAITGLAVDGSTLYTMDGGHTLRAITLTGGALTLIGTLVLPGGGNGLVVGNGVATIPSGDTGGNGGYITVNVADPTHPVLIATDTNRGNAGGAVALNGSGLGLFAGPIQIFAQGLVPELDLVSTTNPQDTGTRLDRFLLPATPGEVAILGGVGFVADGTAGLQVVRYQAFTPNTVAPTVTITQAPTDTDPTTPGTQVIEGSNTALGVSITSPGQIRTVEVLLNGQSVLTGLQYPFALSVTLPTIAANGSSTVTIAVRATDTNGNFTTTAPITLLLVPDLTPPRLLSASVANGSVIATDTHTLQFVFNKPLAPGAASSGNFALHDAQGNTIQATTITLVNNGRTVEAVYPTLPVGAYSYALNAPGIFSAAGVALGSALVTTSFAVQAFTVEWAKPVGGDWNVAANWNTGAVPTATDSVLIGTRQPVVFGAGTGAVAILADTNGELDVTGGTLTVGQQASFGNAALLIQNGSFVANGTASAGRLTLGSGTLAGTGRVTVTSALNWTGGTMAAGGVTVLGANATGSIAGGAVLSRELDVAGSALVTGILAIGGAASGLLSVLAGGTLTLSGTLTTNGTPGDLLQNAGTVTAVNGTLSGITVDGTGGGVLSAVGAGSVLNLATVNLLGGTISTAGGGVVQAVDRGSALSGTGIAAGSTLVVTNNNILSITGTIANAGTLAMASGGNYTALTVTGAATLQGGTVTLSDNAENRILGAAGSTLSNAGLITGSGRIGDASALVLSNAAGGVINATGASVLLVDFAGGTIANAGLIEATATAAGNRGLMLYRTVIDNSGAGNAGRLLADGANAHIDLQTATILGGTLTARNGAVIQTVDRGSLLQNTTITAGTTVSDTNNNFITVQGTLANAGTVQLNSGGNYTALQTVGAVTLSGAGAVVLGDNFENRIVSNGVDSTLRATQAIRGSGRIGDGDAHFTLVNQTTISATGTAALQINSPNTLLNSGVLEDTGPGGLVIQSTTVDGRTGGVIRAVGAGTHVDLVSATIIGGSLLASGGGVIQAIDRGSVLRGANLVASSSILVTNNNILTLQDALSAGANVTLASGGNYTALSIAGAVTLAAGGTVTLSDSAENRLVGVAGSTLANNGLITGSGRVGDASPLVLSNAATGVINATGSAGLLVDFAGGTLANAGLIEATATASGNRGLMLYRTVIDGSANGNAGRLLADGANAHIDLQTATILGGTLTARNGAVIQTVDRGSLLQNTTITAGTTVSDTNNNFITVQGTLNNAGTVQLNSGGNYTALQTVGAVTLSGAGAVVLGDNFENRIVSNGADSTLRATQAIRGSGRIGDGDAHFTLVNQTTISATGTAALQINSPNTVINNGVLEDTGPGGLVIQSTTVDGRAGGVIRAVGAGTHVDLVSATIIGGSLLASGGGVIQAIDRGSVLRGANLVAGSSVLVTNNNILTLQDALSAGANVTLASGGNYTALSIAGAVTLAAGGTVTLSDSAENRLVGAAGSTLANNGLITGSGRVGDASPLVLSNAATGVINATGSAGLLVDFAGATLANAGLIEATATASGNRGLMLYRTVIDGSANGNAGRLLADGANAHIDLQTATILGGTLTARNGAVIQTVDRGSLLQNTTITAGTTVSDTNNNFITVQGTLNNAGTLQLNSGGNYTALQTVGTVTLSGAGAVVLGDNFENRIVSNGTASTLTNASTIQGAGRIGDGDGNFALINQGTINATGAAALRIDTTATVIGNSGTIEATGAGGLAVAGAVSNTGLIWAQGTSVSVGGAVTGAGIDRITGPGTMEFAGPVGSAQQIVFDGAATGTLRLDSSSAFAARITGFAVGDKIDLADFGFVAAGTSATFSGNATGGALLVSNGTATVSVALSGTYTTAAFGTAADPSGHTLVTLVHS